LCMAAQDDGRAQRMVALLVDGLRCGMRPSRGTSSRQQLTSRARPGRLKQA
jgi:hypothetical protein